MKKLLLLALSTLCLSGCGLTNDNTCGGNYKEYPIDSIDKMLIINNDVYSIRYVKNAMFGEKIGNYSIHLHYYEDGQIGKVYVIDCMDIHYTNENYYCREFVFYYYDCSNWEILTK